MNILNTYCELIWKPSDYKEQPKPEYDDPVLNNILNKHTEKDIDDKTKKKIVRISIDLDDVNSIRELINDEDDEIDLEWCLIYLRSGVVFAVREPFNKVLALWTEYIQD